MTFRKLKYIFLILSAATLASCTHAQLEKGLEEKLAVEPDVKNTTALRAQAAERIDSVQGLSPSQRSAIKELWFKTRAETDKMTELSLKLRALLVRDLGSEQDNEAEINLIKKRLSHVENDRLSLYFASVRQTNKILGRWGSTEERYRFFEDMDFADHIR